MQPFIQVRYSQFYALPLVTAATVLSKHVTTKYWPVNIIIPVTSLVIFLLRKDHLRFVPRINWCFPNTKIAISNENEAPDGKKRKEKKYF